MGDVVKVRWVRSTELDKPRRLKLYFDTGSSVTLIRKSACVGFAGVYALPKPRKFRGVGDGRFYGTHIVDMEIRLLGVWCLHPAYVVDDEAFPGNEHVLIGHDFMQRFDIKIDLKRRRIIANRETLESSRIIRAAVRA